MMSAWRKHRRRNPLVMAAQAVFSLGATLGPLIIRPFLVDTPPLHHHNASVLQLVEAPCVNSSVNCSETPETPSHGFVRFAYVSLAAFAVPPSVVFAVLFFLLGPSCRRNLGTTMNRNSSVGLYEVAVLPSRFFHFVIYLLAFFQYTMYGLLETTLAGFLAPFVVEFLGWQNTGGAWITALFWGCQLLGRSVSVPLAIWIKPLRFITCNVLLVLLALFLLLFAQRADSLAWAAAALSGLGLSTFFGSNVLNVSTHIQITGKAGAAVYAGTSVGLIAGPTFVGFLFESSGPQWMTYICICAAFALGAAVITMEVYSKCYEKDRPKENCQVIYMAPTTESKEEN